MCGTFRHASFLCVTSPGNHKDVSDFWPHIPASAPDPRSTRLYHGNYDTNHTRITQGHSTWIPNTVQMARPGNSITALLLETYQVHDPPKQHQPSPSLGPPTQPSSSPHPPPQHPMQGCLQARPHLQAHAEPADANSGSDLIATTHPMLSYFHTTSVSIACMLVRRV